jgi:heme exporter protein A
MLAQMVDFETVVATGLTKTYGATRALAGVSITLQRGEVTLVEGHNGSGKSTLLAMLASLARPTRGSIRYGVHEAEAARGRFGVLSHAPMLYPDLSGRENLELTAELYGLPTSAAEAMIDTLDLKSFADRPVRTYSRGQLQRTSLARALVPSPRLLLLDEPTTGLDEASTTTLVETLRGLRDAGTILFVVTHDTSLATALDGRRLRMERGRILEASP